MNMIIEQYGETAIYILFGGFLLVPCVACMYIAGVWDATLDFTSFNFWDYMNLIFH